MIADDADIEHQARQLIAAVGGELAAQKAAVTRRLYSAIVEASDELSGESQVLELLYASTESNLDTLVHVLRHRIALGEVSAPAAADEYARRLAQRGISSNTLVRAYRIGQRMFLQWALQELKDRQPDRDLAYAAAAVLTEITFQYVDTISEQVVHQYEFERERWLANRNTVRAAVLDDLIAGGSPDPATAEQALGYRLRQHHLGVALWAVDDTRTTTGLRQLQRLLQALADTVGAAGPPLFHPVDRSNAWGWIPLGRRSGPLPDAESAIPQDNQHVFAALGIPAPGPTGFRATHHDASHAKQVALAAEAHARRITSYTDPDVRTVALLTTDLDDTRRLVANALGPLASDDETSARLRETLLTFLKAQSSYTTTAEIVHLHKNTVKYRIDRAVEVRGRALDDDRLELELALLACQWLGIAVLARG